MFEIVYKPEKAETEKTSNKALHLTQRNTRGGAKGDVVVLRDGEKAEITLEGDGVQITAVEMHNVPPVMQPPEPEEPTPEETE
jgi:hypothetical protein